MAGDIAVAVVVAFSAGVMSGMIVTIVVALRRERSRGSLAGQSFDLLDRGVRRVLGAGLRSPATHPDGR